jgi:hypothetical protein
VPTFQIRFVRRSEKMFSPPDDQPERVGSDHMNLIEARIVLIWNDLYPSARAILYGVPRRKMASETIPQRHRVSFPPMHVLLSPEALDCQKEFHPEPLCL